MFRVEEYTKEEVNMKQASSTAVLTFNELHTVTCQKMELFYLHRCGNLKSASVFVSHV
jgi:hypothetical protein